MTPDRASRLAEIEARAGTMDTVSTIPAMVAYTRSVEADRNFLLSELSSSDIRLKEIRDWCLEQGAKLGAVDGYDYRSGQEAAYRHVAIEIDRRLRNAVDQAEGK